MKETVNINLPHSPYASRMTVAALLCLAIPLQAITVDFDEADGYSTTGGNYSNGGLSGQPSGSGVTAWNSTSTNASQETYKVVADTVSGSGQMLTTSQNNPNGTFYTFTASDSDLGGVFDSSLSEVVFSFDLALLASRNSSTTTIQRISFGTTTEAILQFEVLTSGNVLFKANDQTYWSTNSTVDATSSYSPGITYNLGDANNWVTISGSLDYETESLTLWIDGIKQQVAGDTNIAFNSVVTKTQSFNLREINGTSSSYIPMGVDNLELTIIPEPSQSATLLSLVAIGVCLMRKQVDRL